ncbi:MAG: toxin CcdB [Phenylobacterium sp.]|jgi:toxin CcdB
MAQFSLYENQNPHSMQVYPYFVDIQNDLLDMLDSRLVIPVTPYHCADKVNIANLCPKVTIHGESYVLLTHQITSIPLSALKVVVTSLAYLRGEIVDAVDLLSTGI